MLSYNEITQRKYIILDNDPYEVLSSWVFRKQQRKPVNQTKLRNLKTGSTLEHTFHQNDKVREADMSTKPVKFLYHNKGEFWFCDPHNPKDRFELPSEMVGASHKFMKENSEVESLVFNNEIIGISLPVKIDLRVTEAPPSMKGNTAQGGVKQVTLETGATVTTPLFINEGDTIRINTETGEYVERVSKV